MRLTTNGSNPSSITNYEPHRFHELMSCNFSGKLPVCEEDCVLGPWGEWQACSESCGSDGVQQRTRQVEHKQLTGGQPCAPKIERRICLLEPCPT